MAKQTCSDVYANRRGSVVQVMMRVPRFVAAGRSAAGFAAAAAGLAAPASGCSGDFALAADPPEGGDWPPTDARLSASPRC